MRVDLSSSAKIVELKNNINQQDRSLGVKIEERVSCSILESDVDTLRRKLSGVDDHIVKGVVRIAGDLVQLAFDEGRKFEKDRNRA